MSKQYWYSATLRFYVVTANEGRVSGEDSVYLTRAANMEEAFQKFLGIGRREETSYTNWYGHEARNRFVAVAFMDKVGDIDLDGVEISSTPLLEEDPNVTFDTSFNPENSIPEYTGIVPAYEDDGPA
jgi:hypothetical protein